MLTYHVCLDSSVGRALGLNEPCTVVGSIPLQSFYVFFFKFTKFYQTSRACNFFKAKIGKTSSLLPESSNLWQPLHIVLDHVLLRAVCEN